MGKIQILAESVANKIAAGEVIERPSSIVKELLENALDAHATQVEVAIRHGGKSLIRVADNGIGIRPEEVKTAFLRHATSKISSVEDLNHILSFGFRGEALPSIAAVSRTKIQTRARGEAEGVELTLEGGKPQEMKPCSLREGTVLEVRDLFFNTPGRRKFLKSDAAESGSVSDMVSNIALSRLDVRFALKSQDRVVFDLIAGESAQSRASEILGPTTGKHLVEVEAQDQDVKIRGLIGKPQVARANRLGQTLFVNGRWIKAFPYSYALSQGYHGFLMHGQFPVAVLFIEVNPEKADVNVHPTKQEVRLSNDSVIKKLIREMVSKRLAEEGDLARPAAITPQAPFPSGSRSASPAIGAALFESPGSFAASPRGGTLTEESATSQETAPVAIRNQLKITKVLGQIHHTFIVAETEEGMILLDQHAAHERVQFEEVLANFRSRKPQVQKLLMDEVLELSPKHAKIMRNSLSFLNKAGFEIEDFGKDSFVVRSLPATFGEGQAAGILQPFLEEREDGKTRTKLENQEEELAALIACKKRSVRAHDAMAPDLLRALVEKLSGCENPFSCPHGRPTILKLTFEDLEKQFRRKL